MNHCCFGVFRACTRGGPINRSGPLHSNGSHEHNNQPVWLSPRRIRQECTCVQVTVAATQLLGSLMVSSKALPIHSAWAWALVWHGVAWHATMSLTCSLPPWLQLRLLWHPFLSRTAQGCRTGQPGDGPNHVYTRIALHMHDTHESGLMETVSVMIDLLLPRVARFTTGRCEQVRA